MNTHQKIAVMGGGGRTGKYLVTELLRRGYQVRVLLRNPSALQINNSSIEIVQGDALQPGAIHQLLHGCQAVLSTIGQRPGEPLVAAQSATNVLEAMKAIAIKRFVLLGGVNIDTPSDEKGTETLNATNWMKSSYPLIQEDRQEAYSRLMASDIDWTLIRVPFIEFEDIQGVTAVELKDCPGNKIRAGNIAAFMADQLTDERYVRQAPFIANL